MWVSLPSSVVARSSSDVLSEWKLPPSVKKGLEPSVRPCITRPHMHSRTGFPPPSLIRFPSSS